MSEDFGIGCRAKVERADEHIQNLNAENDAFFLSEPKPYRIVREPQEKGVGYVWKGFEDRPLPPIIPILAGEAIHQLRSSLDHLVTGMVRQRGNAVTKDHGFPITMEPKDFKAARKRGQIDGLSLAAQNLIERMQPYNAPKGYDSTVLWTLHRQDAVDKHRLLLVVNAAAFMESVKITGDIRTHNLILQPPQRMTKEGVELFAISTPELGADFDPQVKFSSFIAFEEFGTVKLYPVSKALVEARAWVIHTINCFAGEFPYISHGRSDPAAVQERSVPASRG